MSMESWWLRGTVALAAAAGMAAAIRRVDAINPEVCRAVARARFTPERMTAAYIERYHALAGRSAVSAA